MIDTDTIDLRQTGIGDVLSGSAGGVNGLMTGGANNVANSGGNSVADVSGSAGDLTTRSPQVGVGHFHIAWQ